MSRKARGGGPRSGGDELVFVALGGLGEIGMNAYLYGYGPEDARQWMMVDCGITFPEGEFDPGIDVILPDVRFIEEQRGSLAGLVLTHGHEDHLGAVIELWPRLRVPIYATPFTAALLKSKLAEYGGGLKLPIRDEAVNYFLGVPGRPVPELELTYNFGVDSYELGTAYGHVALTVDDLDATLAELAEQGIQPERAPYTVREGGSRLCFVRDPDGYRVELIDRTGE